MITEKTITDFIYREAELLDTMQWQAWLDLFHPRGATGCRSNGSSRIRCFSRR